MPDAMLCQNCESIDFDKLIPPHADLAAGVVSGTQHYDSLANLIAVAKLGCRLCAAIEKVMLVMIKQAALRERLMPEPTYLKMRLQGHKYPGYQGCSELWVVCLGRAIAQLELNITRGRTYWFLLNNQRIHSGQILF
jgi:hypothetical protein